MVVVTIVRVGASPEVIPARAINHQLTLLHADRMAVV